MVYTTIGQNADFVVHQTVTNIVQKVFAKDIGCTHRASMWKIKWKEKVLYRNVYKQKGVRASLAWGLLLVCPAGDPLLCWAHGWPGVMLYVWLLGTAAAFWSRVYMHFAPLCCGLQAFYFSCHTYKSTLSGDKLTHTHPLNTDTLISTHMLTHLPPDTHTHIPTHT
ncbi:hypothetical protein ATANTOWER_003676 [Ataeniobius toweri]|uniref:Uncharacterized protein n=1 Tax=Ataeniobius toweri TaxID=208326 RepID=A0ABU7A4W7_9TELE|nr:hypothetical protein [Ataeniobius toweri]